MGRKARASPADVDTAPRRIIPFYSDRRGKEFREFSNFYRDAPPYDYTLPTFARQVGLPTTVQCEFSEKAIMLTKAALMGDEEMFTEIMRATDPRTCKSLGRGVRNFDEGLWMQHLEEVAFEVIRQKFEGNAHLRSVLLSTGNAILAEASPNDTLWGIGIGTTDARALCVDQWLGRNILGFALMKARGAIRGDGAELMPAGIPALKAPEEPDPPQHAVAPGALGRADCCAGVGPGSEARVPPGEATLPEEDLPSARRRRWAAT
uniref:NADAR domain-containing protein n=1 Tax=Noctiluca scintillans TaxID=2966 RepID=A0A7S1FG30_NOCSC|mmetsp:Transcript_6057/g.16969  ORF Transcript_6057/g.16969 Transcript_6057/m.16969 type:complete len:263 (+) Transcript_6057:65-853(+)